MSGTNLRHNPQLGKVLSQRRLFFLHDAQAWEAAPVYDMLSPIVAGLVLAVVELDRKCGRIS